MSNYPSDRYVEEAEDLYPRYPEHLNKHPLYRHRLNKEKKRSKPAWADIRCFHCREIVKKGRLVYWDDDGRFMCAGCSQSPRSPKRVEIHPKGSFDSKWTGTCDLCSKPMYPRQRIIYSRKDDHGKVLYAHVTCKMASV